MGSAESNERFWEGYERAMRKGQEPPEGYVYLPKLCSMFCLHRETVGNLTRQGLFPSVKVGYSRYAHPDLVQEWKSKHPDLYEKARDRTAERHKQQM